MGDGGVAGGDSGIVVAGGDSGTVIDGSAQNWKHADSVGDGVDCGSDESIALGDGAHDARSMEHVSRAIEEIRWDMGPL